MQDTQAPSQAPLAGTYFKAGGFARLDALLTTRLGGNATKAQKAEFLRIDYSTYWWLNPHGKGKGNGRGRVRGRVPGDLASRILAAFPKVKFNDLFEIVEEEDGIRAKAAA